ncbi:MAG TPA: Crp/Fnr family transcriptional regulator [Candidatus Acidoferrum sp.]|nr:Crp/Fnr family transcriptional regulator [Candidatus Acidoferrum sp.]
MERNHDSLDSISIFRALTPEARRALAHRCTWRECEPRQEIVRHQDDSRMVYFLIAGKAEVTIYSRSGKKVTFRDIHAGEIFGELAAIDGRPRSASVRATSHCTVAAMSPELFWQTLRDEQGVMTDVLKYLSERVRDLSSKVVDLHTKDVPRRILAELLRVAQPSETEFGNAVLYPAPTAGDIAARVATTRETVARELSLLERAAIIERRGRTLVIPDFKKLRGLVEERDEDAQETE